MITQQILQGVHDWTNGKIVYDISVAHPDGQGKPTPYADLTAALGAGGANIPQGLRKGGMSVKFIKGSAQGSDNKYVQCFLPKDEWSANADDWEKMNLEEEVSRLDQKVDELEDAVDGIDALKEDVEVVVGPVQEYPTISFGAAAIAIDAAIFSEVASEDYTINRIKLRVFNTGSQSYKFKLIALDNGNNSTVRRISEEFTASETIQDSYRDVEIDITPFAVNVDERVGIICDSLWLKPLRDDTNGPIMAAYGNTQNYASVVVGGNALPYVSYLKSYICVQFFQNTKEFIDIEQIKGSVDELEREVEDMAGVEIMKKTDYLPVGPVSTYPSVPYTQGYYSVDCVVFPDIAASAYTINRIKLRVYDNGSTTYKFKLIALDNGNNSTVKRISEEYTIEMSFDGSYRDVEINVSPFIINENERLGIICDSLWIKYLRDDDNGPTIASFGARGNYENITVGTNALPYLSYIKTYLFIVFEEQTGEYIPGNNILTEENARGIAEETFNTDISKLFSLVGVTKVGVLGDSISTFQGYVHYVAYYPNSGYNVDDVSQTYWWMFIERIGAVLDVNASGSGYKTVLETGKKSFYERSTEFVNPGLVIVATGTNDSLGNVPLGDYDYDVEMSSLDETSFRPAYIKGIRSLLSSYPKATVLCIILKMDDSYADSISEIANHYGLVCIDCRNYRTPNMNNVHPTNYGMKDIFETMQEFYGGLGNVQRMNKRFATE